MNILIIGGNGFIGSSIARKCLEQGAQVTAIGRNIKKARAVLPNVNWISQDIGKLLATKDWLPLVKNHDIIINAAGALQSSPSDNVEAVQLNAMTALYHAAKQSHIKHFVQISANTEQQASSTEFIITKREADRALETSGLSYTIIKPALVVARNAFGGTAFNRAIASTPIICPVAYSDAQVQTTNMGDLCDLVWECVKGKHSNQTLAIASNEILSLKEVLLTHRKWLGIVSKKTLQVPKSLAKLGAKFGDLVSLFGWRPPLRTTALEVLEGNVLADPNANFIRCKPLSETLEQNPSGVQDLWFARLYLLKPFLILCLSIFWLASGIIALLNQQPALKMLEQFPLVEPMTALVTTSLLDIVLGITVLFKRFSKPAILLMIATSLAYLTAATLLTPTLWADPIGPLVKVFPSVLFSIVTLAILDER